MRHADQPNAARHDGSILIKHADSGYDKSDVAGPDDVVGSGETAQRAAEDEEEGEIGEQEIARGRRQTRAMPRLTGGVLWMRHEKGVIRNSEFRSTVLSKNAQDESLGIG